MLEQIPLQPLMKAMVKEVVPLQQPMEDHGGAHIHASTRRTSSWSRWIFPKESCSLRKAYIVAGDKWE